MCVFQVVPHRKYKETQRYHRLAKQRKARNQPGAENLPKVKTQYTSLSFINALQITASEVEAQRQLSKAEGKFDA